MMAAPKTTVAVRMYNVGFGDAFLITVRRAHDAWRMLVDCGVHTQGQKRPIKDVVELIIRDLAADSPNGKPHLDVVVATHHHRDHVVGFSVAAWESVSVDHVWVPFVEDETDRDAKELRKKQTATAGQLLSLLKLRARASGDDPNGWPLALAAAEAFAVNSFGNEDATDRLLGRNGKRFGTPHQVHFLPNVDPAKNVISTPITDVVVHVLGPSRAPSDLRLMEPPKNAGWRRLETDDEPASMPMAIGDGTKATIPPLFSASYVVKSEFELDHELVSARDSLKLDEITDEAALLGAASILENAVNNTSLFFLLDVAGTRLLFPGDAQYGAWKHVLDNARNLALIRDAVFYKIGHHGSHNATPKRFVDELLKDGAYAMLPWGLVKRWEKTIPLPELMDALESRHHVIRADAPEPVPDRVTVKDDLWSEVTFTVG